VSDVPPPPVTTPPPPAPADRSVGELIAQVSETTSRLVRDELRLAQLEMAAKGKKAVAALVGKREVAQATPPVPAEAVAGVKQDVQALKPGSHE
jgi:hypothetical protein